jgi:hypothetical protein
MLSDWDEINTNDSMTAEQAYRATCAFLAHTAKAWHSHDLESLVSAMEADIEDTSSRSWENFTKAIAWAAEGKPVIWFVPDSSGAMKKEQQIYWKPNSDGSVTVSVVVDGVTQHIETRTNP